MAVLDVQAPPKIADIAALPEDDIDLRVFAVTPDSARTLRRVGTWEQLPAQRVHGFHGMQVWDGIGGGWVTFQADSSTGELGWVLENRALAAASAATLEHVAEQHGNVHMLWPSKIKGLQLPRSAAEDLAHAGHAGTQLSTPRASREPGSGGRIECEDGTEITARLVVGADGANSAVRSAAGIGIRTYDYSQRGVVSTLRVAGLRNTAWQVFLPSGPVALLPLGDDMASLVWSTTPAHAAALEQASTAELVAALNSALSSQPGIGPGVCSDATASRASLDGGVHTAGSTPVSGGWLPAALAAAADAVASNLFRASAAVSPACPAPTVLDVCGPVRSFPLKSAAAHCYAREGVALIGDAAHSVHPLAGQGLNLGLGDAKELAEVLSSAVRGGADLGDAQVLRKYSKIRTAKVSAMNQVLHTLHWAFHAPAETRDPAAVAGPWAWTRSMGMAGLNMVPPFKAAVATFAMGGADVEQAAAAAVKSMIGMPHVR